MRRVLVALLMVAGMLLPVAPQAAVVAGVTAQQETWNLTVTATKGTASGVATAGVNPTAAVQHDAFDADEPPPPPPPNMRAYFPHDAAALEPWPAPFDTTYSQDIRPATVVLSWNFEIASSAAGAVDLTWDVSAVPAARLPQLKNAAGTVLVANMRTATTFQFTAAAFVPTGFVVDASENQAPTVTVTSPNGGEKIKGTVNVTANAADADGTVASVLFEFSGDNGTSWTAIGAADTAAPYEASWNTSALPDGNQYLVRATATDDKAATTTDPSDATFVVDNSAPAAPNLVSPANGAKTNDTTPDLDWSDVADVSGVTYTVQVDNNADFLTPEVSLTGVAVSNVTIGAALAEGTYNWRVKTVNGVALESAFTAARTFSVDTTAPAAPNLLAPPDGDFTTSNTPTLDWSDVTDPSGVIYDVLVDNNPDFSSPEINETGLAASTHTVAAALANGTYSWRARARDVAGNSGGFSAVRTFKVAVGVVMWQASVTATLGAAAGNGIAGVALDASALNDQYDAAEPPPAPPPNMRLYFPHKAGDAEPFPAPFDQDYSQDIRPVADILTWPVEAQSSAAGTVTVTWDVSAVPAKYIAVMLKDGAGTTLVGDLRTAANHQFTATAFGIQQFQLFIATDQLPVVTVVSPNGGEKINGNFTVKANATDPDGTVTQVLFEYSSDGGATFNNIGTDTTPTGGNNEFSVLWNASAAPNSANYLVRATAMDNLGATASDVSNAVFTVDSTVPAAPNLLAPANAAKTSVNQPVFDWSDVAAGPAGVTYDLLVDNNADFLSAEISQTGLAASTFTPGAALADGTYNWKVRAVSGTAPPTVGAFSTVFTVTVDATAPAAPNLLSPANGAFTNVTTPVLDWSDVTDVSGVTYTVEVDDDPAFGSAISQTGLTASTFTAPALAPGLYSWRVKTVNGATPPLESAFTAARTFTVDTTAPAAPAPVSPANAAVTGATPTLDWSDVVETPAVTYDVQVDDDPAFGSPTSQTGLTASTFTTAALVDGTYSWHARAVDAAGNAGPYSTARTFRVDATAPAAPVLLTPLNNAVISDLRPVFTWTAVTDPSGVVYDWQLAADLNFNVMLATVQQAGTTVTLNANLPPGKFFWRVRSRETGGQMLVGAFSAVSTFTIFVPTPAATAAPTPIPPAAINNLPATDAAKLLAAQAADLAAKTLAAMDASKAAAALAVMDTAKAVAAIARTDVAKAAPIVAAMAEASAVTLMKAATAQQAAAIMSGLDAAKLKAIIAAMTTAEATERLARMSLDAVAKLSAEDLAKAVPNLPFKQTVAEKAPAAAAGLADPKARYVLSYETLFDQVKTAANDWATLAGARGPVNKLVARTGKALANVETTITDDKARLPSIAVNPPGVVNSYFGVTTTVDPADIIAAWLEFKVDKKWINDNNINPWSVTLQRYDEALKAWMSLQTKRVSEDATSVTYTATLPGTSVFAITGSTTLPAATFKVANLTIPASVETGKAATISIDVTNSSASAAPYVSELWINDVLEDVTSASIAAGATSKVSFSVTRATAGSYNVRVDSLSGKLTVEAPKPPATPVPLPPAKLAVTGGLKVSPTEVQPGQMTVITTMVENTGGQSGTLSVVLKVNGTEAYSQAITVAAGKSQEVTFTVARGEPGVYNLDVGGQTGTVKVLKPSAFAVSQLSVSPDKVKTGEAVTVTARVTNSGEIAGSYTAEFKLNGQVKASKTVALDKGASATVTFSAPTDVAGTYTVDVGGQTSGLEITKPFNVWVVIGPIIGVIVVLLVVFLMMRKKPKAPEAKPVA